MKIVGASFDAPAANAKFVEKLSFPFPILTVDPATAVAYGAAKDESAKHTARVSVVVGPDGRVERIYDKVDAKTHPETVMKDLGLSPR